MIDDVLRNGVLAQQPRLEEMIFDIALRLSSAAQSKIFLLVQSPKGERRCCGADELVEAYVKGLLFPLQAEKELRLKDGSILTERNIKYLPRAPPPLRTPPPRPPPPPPPRSRNSSGEDVDMGRDIEDVARAATKGVDVKFEPKAGNTPQTVALPTILNEWALQPVVKLSRIDAGLKLKKTTKKFKAAKPLRFIAPARPLVPLFPGVYRYPINTQQQPHLSEQPMSAMQAANKPIARSFLGATCLPSTSISPSVPISTLITSFGDEPNAESPISPHSRPTSPTAIAMPWSGPHLTRRDLMETASLRNHASDQDVVPRFPAYVPAVATFKGAVSKKSTSSAIRRRHTSDSDGIIKRKKKKSNVSVFNLPNNLPSVLTQAFKPYTGTRDISSPSLDTGDVISCFNESEVSVVPVTLTENGESFPVQKWPIVDLDAMELPASSDPTASSMAFGDNHDVLRPARSANEEDGTLDVTMIPLEFDSIENEDSFSAALASREDEVDSDDVMVIDDARSRNENTDDGNPVEVMIREPENEDATGVVVLNEDEEEEKDDDGVMHTFVVDDYVDSLPSVDRHLHGSTSEKSTTNKDLNDEAFDTDIASLTPLNVNLNSENVTGPIQDACTQARAFKQPLKEPAVSEPSVDEADIAETEAERRGAYSPSRDYPDSQETFSADSPANSLSASQSLTAIKRSPKHSDESSSNAEYQGLFEPSLFESTMDARDRPELGDNEGPLQLAGVIFEPEVVDPLLILPLTDYGWKRELVWRKTTGDANRTKMGDIYYFAPTGKKLRTMPNVLQFLDETRNTTLSKKNFSFKVRAVGSPVNEVCRSAADTQSRVSLG